jgi:hypothetical protein
MESDHLSFKFFFTPALETSKITSFFQIVNSLFHFSAIFMVRVLSEISISRLYISKRKSHLDILFI